MNMVTFLGFNEQDLTNFASQIDLRSKDSTNFETLTTFKSKMDNFYAIQNKVESELAIVDEREMEVVPEGHFNTRIYCPKCRG